MQTMPDQRLTPEQVALLTQAMMSVALVDGLQPAESALIGQFYDSARNGAMPATAAFLAEQAAQKFDAAALAGSTAEFADTVVLMCLMTGYADGQLSPAERSHVQAMASALGLNEARFEAHLAQVRDELVGALSHLPDAGSVAVVVRELSAAD